MRVHTNALTGWTIEVTEKEKSTIRDFLHTVEAEYTVTKTEITFVCPSHWDSDVVNLLLEMSCST